MNMDTRGKYKLYPAYKDSGIEWLGKVPEYWQISPLKYEFRVIGGSTPKSDNEKYWDGNIVWVTPSDLSKLSSIGISDSQRKITAEGLSSCGTTLVPSGSVILSTRAPIGSLAIAENNLCTNQGCKSLIPNKDIQSKFYAYLLSINTDELNIRGKGTTFLELSGDELRAFEIPVPPIVEQQALAAFLDRETSKIDTLTTEQERLIELLQEKRTALISHAVTKGLNPEAPMKDSGVEWLGDVPEHWDIKRLKYVAEIIDGDRSSAYPSEQDIVDEGIPFLSSKNIIGYKFSNINLQFISQERFTTLSRGKVKDKDLVITVRGTIGHVAIYEAKLIGYETAFINAQMMIMRPIIASPNFLHAISESEFWRKQLNIASYGTAQQQLSNEILQNIYLVVPPLEEQEEIIAFLDRESTKIDALIAKSRQAIDLLKERRTALISAAVTGKIDVRDTIN